MKKQVLGHLNYSKQVKISNKKERFGDIVTPFSSSNTKR